MQLFISLSPPLVHIMMPMIYKLMCESWAIKLGRTLLSLPHNYAAVVKKHLATKPFHIWKSVAAAPLRTYKDEA